MEREREKRSKNRKRTTEKESREEEEEDKGRRENDCGERKMEKMQACRKGKKAKRKITKRKNNCGEGETDDVVTDVDHPVHGGCHGRPDEPLYLGPTEVASLLGKVLEVHLGVKFFVFPH